MAEEEKLRKTQLAARGFAFIVAMVLALVGLVLLFDDVISGGVGVLDDPIAVLFFGGAFVLLIFTFMGGRGVTGLIGRGSTRSRRSGPKRPE